MTEIGHNSTAAREQIKAFVERVERIEGEIADLQSDRKDIYAEAKANGLDVKALRTVIRLRKQDAAERAEQQAIVDTYMHALGMLADLPLGQAALKKAGA